MALKRINKAQPSHVVQKGGSIHILNRSIFSYTFTGILKVLIDVKLLWCYVLQKAVEDIVTFARQVSQSFVIGLTGAEIFITSLGFQTVGLCLATKFLAVAVQIVATLMIGSGFHWKEKLSIPLAWIPKATVQFHQTISEAEV